MVYWARHSELHARLEHTLNALLLTLETDHWVTVKHSFTLDLQLNATVTGLFTVGQRSSGLSRSDGSGTV